MLGILLVVVIAWCVQWLACAAITGTAARRLRQDPLVRLANLPGVTSAAITYDNGLSEGWGDVRPSLRAVNFGIAYSESSKWL